jgi:hypothetical protein
MGSPSYLYVVLPIIKLYDGFRMTTGTTAPGNGIFFAPATSPKNQASGVGWGNRPSLQFAVSCCYG